MLKCCNETKRNYNTYLQLMKKVLHIFDMDDCLLCTPTMVDFIDTDSEGYVINPEPALKSHMKKLENSTFVLLRKELKFKKSGDFIVVINAKNRKPFGLEFIELIEKLKREDIKAVRLPERTINEMKRAVTLKDGIVVLEPFGGFYSSTSTIGRHLNSEVAVIYNSVDNKMILTGREDDIVKFNKWKNKKENSVRRADQQWQDAVDRADSPEKKLLKLTMPKQGDSMRIQIKKRESELTNMKIHIAKRLKELSLEYPNFGLMLYSGEGGISTFKSKAIENIVKKNGLSEVHYYEDREDWLNAAESYLQKVLPKVKFHGHLIANVKNERHL